MNRTKILDMTSLALATTLSLPALGCSDCPDDVADSTETETGNLEPALVATDDQGRTWIELEGWDAYALCLDESFLAAALVIQTLVELDPNPHDGVADCYAYGDGSSYICAVDVGSYCPLAAIPVLDDAVPTSAECQALAGPWDDHVSGPLGACFGVIDGLAVLISEDPGA